MIRTQRLSVGYNGIALIEDINLNIEPGELITLIGPNGAGKTTILKTIIKALKAVSGVVYIGEENLEKIDQRELSKLVSVVMTGRPHTELMTVRDVVADGRYPYTGTLGILSKADWEYVDKAIELCQIKDIEDRDFNCISDGQRQRVLLAKALCQKAKIIVLDEPTTFLDVKYRAEFLSILRQLVTKEKITVIMSMHEIELARRISDKIICVANGRVDRIGSPEEIFADDYVAGLFGMTQEEYEKWS